jgi:hypothetical protein
VASVDTGFVAATPGRVFQVVADPAAYPRWWPGTLRAPAPGIGRAEYRLGVVRPGVELTVRLQGRRHGGRLQWYLEPFEEGTVVYGIVDLETDRRWTVRRQRGVRAGIRAALVALKELLE